MQTWLSRVVHVCVAIILHGESPYAHETLAALRQQELDEGTNISLVLVDNGMPPLLRSEILEEYAGKLVLLQNRENLGFSAAVNQALAEACSFKADFLLLLNPDLLLDTVAVRELLRAAARHTEGALFTPKLLRANADLSPSEPALLDACGMLINSELRHLDRGSGEPDQGQYQSEQEVFGGTGACLLIRLNLIKELLLPRSPYEKDLWKIYPQLEQGAESRPQLMDEAFFAYREDADLCWRAQIFCKEIFYCPLAVGHHIRRVLPENRSSLPVEINLWSVRNRFLLQLNNLKFFCSLRILLAGVLCRNTAVLLALLLVERSSLPAVKQVWLLRRRALANRKFIMQSVNMKQYRQSLKWFFLNRS